MDVAKSVAVISGGASGLGEATARALVAKGAKVALLDVTEESGRHVAADLGSAAIFCKTDVTDGASVTAAVGAAVEAFGGVHVAVNCAGVATPGKVLGKEGPLSIEAYTRVVQINLIGTMNVIRLAAQQMAQNPPNDDGERGVIVDTASIAAFEGQFGQAAYASSKAGVVGLALPVARELARSGIRIMTIAPGMFETPMMGGMPEKVTQSLLNQTLFPKRFGKPEEYAGLVLHIIDNVMLNGSCIRLDGGVRMGAT